MRAGLLKERIEVLELRKITSETGSERKEFVPAHTIKAYRKKLSASVGTGVNASEEFIENTIVFQIRRYSFINETSKVRYNGNRYKVILIDRQLDNTLLITLSKDNE